MSAQEDGRERGAHDARRVVDLSYHSERSMFSPDYMPPRESFGAAGVMSLGDRVSWLIGYADGMRDAISELLEKQREAESGRGGVPAQATK